jgi:hypothetical protein
MSAIQATTFSHKVTYAVVAPIARRAAAAALKYTIFLRSLDQVHSWKDAVKEEKYEQI